MTDPNRPDDAPGFSSGASLNGQPVDSSAGAPPFGAPGQPQPGQAQPGQWPPAGAYPGSGYPAGQYGAQGQYGAYAPQPVTRTNILAILSLIAPFFGLGIAGLVMGPIALGQIKKTGEQGRGLAIAGIIVSAVFIVLTVVVGIVYVIWFGYLVSNFGDMGELSEYGEFVARAGSGALGGTA